MRDRTTQMGLRMEEVFSFATTLRKWGRDAMHKTQKGDITAEMGALNT